MFPEEAQECIYIGEHALNLLWFAIFCLNSNFQLALPSYIKETLASIHA
jgi:hypothetical protein